MMTHGRPILVFLQSLNPKAHEGAPAWKIAHATRLPSGAVRTALTALEMGGYVVSSWQPRGIATPKECLHWITDQGREYLENNAGVTP